MSSNAARGRAGKENVVTILATQAYEDLSTLPDIAKTAGVKIIGKQIGDYAKLVEDSGLSFQAAAAIGVIHNVPGSHAQFLLALGSGEDKIVEMVQCDLSPTELRDVHDEPRRTECTGARSIASPGLVARAGYRLARRSLPTRRDRRRFGQH